MEQLFDLEKRLFEVNLLTFVPIEFACLGIKRDDIHFYLFDGYIEITGGAEGTFPKRQDDCRMQPEICHETSFLVANCQ